MPYQKFDQTKTAPARQIRAVELLAHGLSKSRVAEDVGVSEDTIRRWCQDPNFRNALLAAKSNALDEIGRSLLRVGSKAVGTLETLLDDPTLPASVRERAATNVLSNLFKAWETMSVEERLNAIEAQLVAARQGTGDG
jgi:hypothetical protein